MYLEQRAGNYPISEQMTMSLTSGRITSRLDVAITIPIYSNTATASANAATATTTLSAPMTSAPSSSTAPKASAAPTSYTIAVGAAALDPHAFVPAKLNNVNVGDKIVFEFYPTNHSVVRAAYGTPCIPYEDVVQGGKGFHSDPFLVDTQFAKPQWSFTVDSTDPIFFYCTAIDSCLKNGMVGAINPNSTQTFEAQKQKALEAKVMLVPGQPFPAEGSGVAQPSASASATPDSSGHHLSNGAIAGIAVAAVIVAILVGALFFLLGRNKVYKKWVASERGDANARTNAWLAGSKPGPWSSDVGSSRAPEDQSHSHYGNVTPGHPSMMSMSPNLLASMDPSWRGGASPPPGQAPPQWHSMYGAPNQQQYGYGGYASPPAQHEVSEIGGGEVTGKGGATSGALELSADSAHDRR